jgi:hypothetical protein
MKRIGSVRAYGGSVPYSAKRIIATAFGNQPREKNDA